MYVMDPISLVEWGDLSDHFKIFHMTPQTSFVEMIEFLLYWLQWNSLCHYIYVLGHISQAGYYA